MTNAHEATMAGLDALAFSATKRRAEIRQLRADLRDCRSRLAELVAAEDELDRLGRYVRDPDVDEHEWDAAWARIEQRREHAIDAMRDWLAQHPETGHD